jgi:hypothetical protein
MLAIFLIGAALAADSVEIDESSDRKVIYRQKTEIDFEGLDIEGILVKPSSSLILERKKAAFNPLVKIRTDWNDMIEESIDEAK